MSGNKPYVKLLRGDTMRKELSPFVSHFLPLCACVAVCLALVYCGEDTLPTAPDVATPTPTPAECRCSKGKILIKQGNRVLSPPTVRPFEWYLASATQWFNDEGQTLPEECSWNQFTAWGDPINGGCKLYDGSGDPERSLWCTTASDAVRLTARAKIGGAMCHAETTFRVSRDEY
jgi:hypothetical protein